jgi:SNF2 family DNA or RNA helicase
MSSQVFIEDGEIWTLDGSNRVSGAPLDVFNAVKSGDLTLRGVRVLGIASPQIFIYLDSESRPTFTVRALVGLECFDIGSQRPKHHDYVILDSDVIPLRQEAFALLFNALSHLDREAVSAAPESLANALLKIAAQQRIDILFSEDFQYLLDNLPIVDVTSPTSTKLWPYQEKGFSWMFRLWANGLGGVLGDEMGVGKTLQLLALTCEVSRRQQKKPALIVVPGSLLLKWCRDFVNSAPDFADDIHVHSGPSRPRSIHILGSCRIILTSYSILVQDAELFSQLSFSVVCCDEAHELKESRTLKSSTIRHLDAEAKFLATGTPIQNRLADYWTLIDIVEPGLLGTKEEFESRCDNTPAAARILMRQTTHRILRRTQEQVAIDIPEGTKFTVPLLLDEFLFGEYLQLELDTDDSRVRTNGFASERRRFCAHPGSSLEGKPADMGPKCSYLIDELTNIVSLGEKAVVFVADFNEPRDLYRELIQFNFPSLWTGVIDGRTDSDMRYAILDSFSSEPQSAVLLVNPAVGGQGLDMIAANHVFHMNPAWNPAKTDQATFRVQRPGQTKETWSHHLFYAGTIEERIENLVGSKRALSDAALEEAERESQNDVGALSRIIRIDKRNEQ